MQTTNSKQRKTLEKIFTNPAPNNILWEEIESLIRHLGCVIEYRGGSKVKFTKNAVPLFVHRPHPSNQTPPQTISNIREFLIEIGVTP